MKWNKQPIYMKGFKISCLSMTSTFKLGGCTEIAMYQPQPSTTAKMPSKSAGENLTVLAGEKLTFNGSLINSFCQRQKKDTIWEINNEKITFLHDLIFLSLYINRECNFKEKKTIFDPFWNQNRQTFNVDVKAKNIYTCKSSQELNQKICESITTILILLKEEKL